MLNGRVIPNFPPNTFNVFKMEVNKYLILVAIFCELSFGSITNPVFLDLNEINLVQYDVKIGDDPIVLDGIDSDATSSKVIFRSKV